MSDWADLAAEREQQLRDAALADQARRAGAPAALSAVLCAVCEAPLPEARRRALPGVQTCVACQEDLERALAGPGGAAPRRRKAAA